MTRDNYAALLADPAAFGAELETQLRTASEAARNLAATEAEYELLEARALLEATAAVGPDGKPSHTNEAARKAAALVLLDGNDAARKLRNDLYNTRRDRDEAEAVVTALKTLARLAARETGDAV